MMAGMQERRGYGVQRWARLSLLLVMLLCSASIETGEAFGGWLWWKSAGHAKKQKATASSRERQRRREGGGHAAFESVKEGAFQTHRPLIQEAQQMLSIRATSDVSREALQPSCWQSAYGKLYASCREILRDEEKKCRLAFEFTHCFLTITGWPPPPPCPDSKPVKSCTEKFDRHTHEVYLAFFVDSVAMCHHLQSEAFQQETDEVVNDLKHSGHWILEKVKEVEDLSHQILDDTLEQSEKVQEKLSTVEAHSELLLQQHTQLEGLLTNTLGTVEAVYSNSDQVIQMQMELKDIHQEMNSTLLAGFKELDHAAQHTQQQLTHISQGQDEIARQQVHLANALSLNIQRLKESALNSLDELKDSQAMAMDETRSSLKGLSEGTRRAQLNFELWREELDRKNQLLLAGSEDMLRAQEAFVSKQGSILATLDRLFSLYDSILYESRALKMFLFYATSLVFLHVLTSAKQTNSARSILYTGLCISMATELYLIKTYGTLLINQQWLHASCYWIRAVLAAFTALVIALFILTYRDINWKNHQLLLEIRQKLNEPSIQPEIKSTNSDQFSFEEIKSHDNGPRQEMPSLHQLSLRPSSQKQAIASKIIHRVHKFMRRGRGNKRLLHRGCGVDGSDDPLRAWMTSHGMDTSVLDCSDTNSDDSGDDPDYVCPAMSSCTVLPNQYHTPDRYLLRSHCNDRCRRPPPWRTYL